MADPVRVVLADDHPLMLSGIRSTLSAEPDIDIAAEAMDGDDVVEACRRHAPDVLVMDLAMPGMSFVERVRRVKEIDSGIKVLVLSALDDAVYVQAMFRAGVDGYLLKEDVGEALVVALRSVVSGGSYFSRKVWSVLQNVEPYTDALRSLTEREREVLGLIAAGKGNTEIAEELGLAAQTVRNYVSRLYDKLGVRTRVALAIWARDHGLGGRLAERDG